jgi:hypothetical protein
MKKLIVFLIFTASIVTLANSQKTFLVGQNGIKKVSPKAGQVRKQNSGNELSRREDALQRREVFQTLENRPYGEAQFSGIVMSQRRVQEAGGVNNCYVTLRITRLDQNRYQPIPGLKRGDIVRQVLDTPLCELRVGSTAKGLLIDNNFIVDGQRGLMFEMF